jgi:hypothetical protein
MVDTNTGREIKEVIEFSACGTFGAVNKAEAKAKELGFAVGSMCRDLPMALADASKYDYIAKWEKIARSEHKYLTGILTSNDFREGAVSLVIFK